MKKSMKIFFATNYIMITISSVSFSQSIEFSSPILQGSGCPPGTTATSISPDGTSLSVLFDQMQASVPNHNRDNDNDETEENDEPEAKTSAQLQHKICRWTFQATIPEGFRAQALALQTDFRGFLQADPGTRSLFRLFIHARHGLGGEAKGRALIEERVWRNNRNSPGTLTEEFTINSQKTYELGNKCARNKDRTITIHLRNVIQARVIRGMNRNESRLPSNEITVDSGDLTGSVKARIAISPCEQNPRSRR